MLTRARLRWSTERTWLMLDAGVVAVLLAASGVEIASSGRVSGWGGPPAASAVVAAFGTVPLLARRRVPVGTALLLTAAAGASIGLVAPDQAPYETFVPLLLSYYSVGALAASRESVASIAAVSAGVAAVSAAGLNAGASNTVPAGVLLLASWAVGRVVRSRTSRGDSFEQLAAARERQAADAIADERARIARELHDIVAHHVSVMVVHAQAGQRLLHAPEPDAREALQTIENVGRQTVDELRRLLGILRRDDRLALGSPPSLSHAAVIVRGIEAAGLDVEFSIAGEPPHELPTGVDVAAYRVLQEALTNALKYSADRRATACVRFAADAVEVEVCNTGALRQAGDGTGHGLIGMRERVTLYGGTLQAAPEPAGGFAVHARLPYAGGAS